MRIYIKKTPFKTEAEADFTIDELSQIHTKLPDRDIYLDFREIIHSIKEWLD